MQLWPVLLWPKPKARQQIQRYGKSNINFHFTTRTSATPVAAATTLFYAVVINALLLITSTWGLTVAPQQATANYAGVNDVADVDVMAALTGLSNGYAASNYMKNYYQVSESEAIKQQQIQQQQQQQHYRNNKINAAAVHSGHQEEIGAAAGINSQGFMGLQANIYGNSRANSARVGREEGGGRHKVDMQAGGFSPYNGEFMPLSFTAAGEHYSAALQGLQTAKDTSNTLDQYGTTAANKNNLHANYQPYVNVNSNSKNNINNNNNNNNDIIAMVDNQQAQQSLFRRLSNYGGGLNNGGGGFAIDTSAANLDTTDDDGSAGGGDGGAINAIAGKITAEAMQKYALTYADDAQQSPLQQNSYNQQIPFNNAQSVPEQIFANYFPPSVAAATAGYETENQQKYYALNNYKQTMKPLPKHEQQQYVEYQQQQQQQQHQQQLYGLQQHQQTFNKLEMLTATPAPATYYQTYVQHKNDKKENQQQHRHIVDDNYYRWQPNQIMANYQAKQSAIEKLNQQQQQQLQTQAKRNNQYHLHYSSQEPETAETSVSALTKKSPKNKSKRHDNHDEQNYHYDAYEQNAENTIEHEPYDYSNVQLQQLENLQEQLQQQQKQFVELQHQLIDHDQQLQIQKYIVSTPAPTLPPITQTVHHNPHSLQALSGAPLSKHIHVVRNIPVPQHQQIHVPYRENVTVEVPDAVITPIRKPLAIQIPITRTVAVPNIQEVKIPIERVRPFPVERPMPYLVERRVPYTVEKQVAQPVYYPVPIKVPILHTVIHKMHTPHGPQQQQQSSYHLPHTVYRKSQGGGHGHGHAHGHAHHY